jgi:glutamate racemase
VFSVAARHSSPISRHSAALPIGVFDSGVGGLTVLRALRAQLPQERFVYLGDTARLPYGTKSRESVLRYSTQAADALVRRGIKFLVVACNTASSVAIEALREKFSPMPVIGVIEPGAAAGCRASKTGRIAVIATEGTVRGGAYQAAIARIRPEMHVVTKACSLFVALAEEGWIEGPVVEAVAHRYLAEMFSQDAGLDTLVLGCTHFPLLLAPLRKTVGPKVTIVDSAQTTATVLSEELNRLNLTSKAQPAARPILLATDSPERFARVGSLFLGDSFGPEQVELVDLSPDGGER